MDVELCVYVYSTHMLTDYIYICAVNLKEITSYNVDIRDGGGRGSGGSAFELRSVLYAFMRVAPLMMASSTLLTYRQSVCLFYLTTQIYLPHPPPLLWNAMPEVGSNQRLDFTFSWCASMTASQSGWHMAGLLFHHFLKWCRRGGRFLLILAQLARAWDHISCMHGVQEERDQN